MPSIGFRFGRVLSQRLYALLPARSVSAKLALVFALFLAPYGLMTLKISSDQQAKIDVVKRQQLGLDFTMVARSVRVMIDQEIRASELGAYDVARILRAASILEQANTRMGGRLGLQKETARAVGLIRELPDALAERRRTVIASTRNAMRNLARAAGTNSSLILASSLERFRMTDLFLTKAPELADSVRVLSLAAGRVDRSRPNVSERVEIAGALDAFSQALEEIDAAALSTGLVVTDAAVAQGLQDVQSTSRLYRQHINDLLANGNDNPERLIALEQALGQRLFSFTNLISLNLANALEAHKEQLTVEQLRAMGGALALFLLIPALGVLLLRGNVVEPIDQLTSSIKALAAGDYGADVPGRDRVDEIGEIARAVVILRNEASARIAAEAARTAADSANAAKSQFVANMSHELRTPLNAIIGYTELVLEEAADRGDEAAARDLRRVLAAARHLLTLINDILDLSKIEAGKMEVHRETVKLADVIADITGTAEPLAVSNGNRFTVKMDNQDATLITDTTKLRQCLLNLLSNACKFTKQGEITLTATARTIGERREWRFAVADTGIGMSPAQMKLLFNAFSQADASITREFGGTGLGLMLTRRMAQLLNGDVSVSSQPGKGSTFTLSVSDLIEGEVQETSGFSPGQRYGAEEAPLCIVIDDEHSSRDLAMRALTGAHCAAISAVDAASGLALARATRPALIVLDIYLPDQPGWQVIETLRSDPITRDVPILVLSIDADRQKSISLGAAEHLVKPATRDLLAATALRFIRRQAAPPRAVRNVA